MICSHCGSSSVANSAIFCSNCGSPLAIPTAAQITTPKVEQQPIGELRSSTGDTISVSLWHSQGGDCFISIGVMQEDGLEESAMINKEEFHILKKLLLQTEQALQIPGG